MAFALRRLAAAGAVLMVALAVLAGGNPGPAQYRHSALAVPPSAVNVATLEADEATAVAAVDAYWRRHFAELFGPPYRSPRVAGAYVGTNGPRCAGQPSAPYNAFYCIPEDFLAWDQDLMAAGYRKIGDGWVYLVIAHEWGHAIQARLARGMVSVAAELQADCLAGAALRGASRDGLITFDTGDEQEIARALAAVADDYPWTMEADHGNARQRTAAFNRGTGQGALACV